MKTSSAAALIAAMAVVGGLGFALGKLSQSPSDPAPAGRIDSGKGRPKVEATPRVAPKASVLSPHLEQLLPPGSLADGEIRSTTLRVLAEPDPARRMAAVGLLLNSMTAANAESIREAFRDSTMKTGRKHDIEWGIMILQFGKVLGPKAQEILKEGYAINRTRALEGWASADPDGAMASLEPASPDRPQLLESILAGIARSDPERAFRIAMESEGTSNAQHLVNQAILNSGMEGATAAMQRVFDGAGLDAAVNPRVETLFTALTEALIFQKFTAGESEKILPWLEAQKGQPFLREGLVNRGVKDVVLQGKLQEALGWMDRMNEGASGNPLGTKGVLTALNQQPDLLTTADPATVERITNLALANSSTTMSDGLLAKLEQMSPAHAKRIREQSALRAQGSERE